MYPLLTILAILVVYTYFRFENIRLRILFLYALVAILFSIGLMEYQLAKVHAVRYYYFKSTYTYILLVAPLLGALGGELTQSLLSYRPKIHLPSWAHRSIVVAVVIIVGSVSFWSLKSVAFSNLVNDRLSGISPAQADAITNLLHQNPQNGYRLIPIGSCNRGDDIRAMLFANALAYTPNNSLPNINLNVELTPLNEATLFKQINYFLNHHPERIYILSSDQVIGNNLMQALGRNAHFIQLINLDPTPQTEPVSQCPNRVRMLTPQEIASGLS